MTPTAMTIAGSDSGGGAGIQADLKTFAAFGVFGTSAITAITAQNTRAVTRVDPVAPATIAAQMRTVLADIRIDAVKIGMVGDAAAIAAVASALPDRPVVLDPVMVAKSGDLLLPEDAVDAMVAHLLPRATVLTPNLPEAARLTRLPLAGTEAAMLEQARALRAMGAAFVLMKGGHAEGPVCVDLLVGDGVHRLAAPRQATRNTHGTGCTLSAAIAAGLARGQPMEEAVTRAHRWLQGAIAAADGLGLGHGHGPVHHFHSGGPQ
ncbi:bifunctional hydroxymethylpyrimidine kinase/phosphomethylpyrimidine kinase [Falsirhodobacter halotolerans]|uniref:bifunctional hydroxymethylpyrimidine kinase/phosphomethylpyrimidine kinase n=1 Tax=Falsirhodobacter halotolerans TaxID=1146892 RepID=UPI001FD15A17|nr:bifunctional hydroxymethylpyrimidine kinase/phosphomethylpyrimidine kinase [Falsirhodobacter halotolerans]MCJ8139002.1 bifunctional hydroxymethylpyrimidine kinase/phosphomethylpyrimidine kinase [Falsirhodobacter halotolerans]